MTRLSFALLLVLIVAAFGGGNVDNAGLASGECVVFPDDAQAKVTKDDVVECGGPHDIEVYYVIEFDAGQEHPGSGSDALDDPRIRETCIGEAEVRVDLGRLEPGDYELQPLVPGEAEWDAGLREVYCVVDGVGGPTEGSVLLPE